MRDLINTSRESVQATCYAPNMCIPLDDGSWFIDFGKARFATLKAQLPNDLIIELAEVLDPENPYTLSSNPGGSRRYRKIKWSKDDECLIIPSDERNTTAPAVLVPGHCQEVLPFRYAIIHHWPQSGFSPEDAISMYALSVPFEHEGRWSSSNRTLNEVDDLCRHTMEATTFLGIYVDGDRERIAYEGDALINQLGHAACNADSTIAGATIEHLIKYPTWPAEWHLQLTCCAWGILIGQW